MKVRIGVVLGVGCAYYFHIRFHVRIIVSSRAMYMILNGLYFGLMLKLGVIYRKV